MTSGLVLNDANMALKVGDTSIGVCTNFESGDGMKTKSRAISRMIEGNHAFRKYSN